VVSERPARNQRVVVVGGGLAGITAALELADAGLGVTLLEARPRLGGATHSFQRGGLWVDNGQHVFLRCCTAYQGLLERLGVAGLVRMQRRLDIPVLLPDGRSARLRRSALPAPLHLLTAISRYQALRPRDRLRAMPAANALRRLDPRDPRVDAQDFGTWLAGHGQSAQAVTALWGLITTAALNAPPHGASLGLAAMVFQTGLLASRTAADIGLPGVHLAALHSLPAQRALQSAGVGVRLRERARAVDAAADGFLVRCDDASYAADAVVVAVPSADAAAVLTGPVLPGFRALEAMPMMPILNVHVRYDRAVAGREFAAVLDSPVQWVFDRTRAAGLPTGQYLAVTVSAATELIDAPTHRLREVFLPALARLFPAARGAVVQDFFATRQPMATVRQAPGIGARRPGCRTAVDGLFLAGAWTDTGWPDTMEGAVRSGQTAAAAVRSSFHASARPSSDSPTPTAQLAQEIW
jgi:squalene-associated FAD-dependent desaturase